MTRGMGGQSSSNIARYLKGIDFPATKHDLIEYAEDSNAPDEVIEVLDQMPNQEYRSMADLMQGVGQAK